MEKDQESELIIRDYLARQRTTLSNKRTLLSFIRTSLYFLVSGTALFEVEKLSHVRELGYVAFGLSIIFLAVGISTYYQVRRKLRKGRYLRM